MLFWLLLSIGLYFISMVVAFYVIVYVNYKFDFANNDSIFLCSLFWPIVLFIFMLGAVFEAFMDWDKKIVIHANQIKFKLKQRAKKKAKNELS